MSTDNPLPHDSDIVSVKDEETGETVRGVVVKLLHSDEPPCYYRLADGSQITHRVTMSQVIRFVDRWNADGSPRYQVTMNGSLTINSPKNLKKSGDTDGS